MKRSRSQLALLWMPVLVIGALTLACGERDPLPDGMPAVAACNTCHGGDANAAPPAPLHGAGATSEIPVSRCVQFPSA